MEVLKGNVEEGEKKFAVINTTDYNMDGNYSIIVFGIEDAGKLGFDEEETKRIDALGIGDQAMFEYGVDAQVIRLG